MNKKSIFESIIDKYFNICEGLSIDELYALRNYEMCEYKKDKDILATCGAVDKGIKRKVGNKYYTEAFIIEAIHDFMEEYAGDRREIRIN